MERYGAWKESVSTILVRYALVVDISSTFHVMVRTMEPNGNGLSVEKVCLIHSQGLALVED